MGNILNQEKISKSFCNIFRATKDDSSLSLIRNSNGADFNSKPEQARYINSFYQNIYKKKKKTLSLVDFLGSDIANNDEVLSKKLPDDKKRLLDLPLSISELDLAIEKSNKQSAPGPDGWNNIVLQFFWPTVRSFLLKSFNFMLENKSLSGNLALANIRLIPKKGSLNDISNWRPICLLSCFYKVISSAITARLKTVIDHICSTHQKGFSSSKTIHMAILNILNNISVANSGKSDAFICAVDFKKAFDFINHEYIIEVFRFFNFGEYFIDLISTILNGRRGGILIDNIVTET